MSKRAPLSKHYQPSQCEERIYRKWESRQAFSSSPSDDKQSWTVMMPPPNVTGHLHMGHALNMSLQDLLVRFERMRGKNVLWQAGTDHAGIATQAIVEKNLASQTNQTRQEIGREKFLKEMWAWKERSGDNILTQLRKLGVSCDWSRARFTLDDGMSKAVRHAFIALYRDGLIYRDKRLVNWDVKLKTAISDLEVVQKEIDGHLWYLRYPLADGDGSIIVATTRPETMLGDVAVAVHPDDERYRHLHQKQVRLPFVDRLIPIIADDYVDSALGFGAVKITPAHDFNDFEIGRRHNLPLITMLDEQGAVVKEEWVPKAYQGLSRERARQAIVTAFEEAGLLDKIDNHRHSIPYGDRSFEVIEPFLTDQWYVDVQKMARQARQMVERGESKFVPKTWEKNYFEWLDNIQPWCVSRQLWWGHPIPIWYAPNGESFAAENEEDAHAQARAHFGEDTPLKADEDVLDTWFSSSLWPFSTLGWPEQTKELEHYFPTQILITGFDIIFFWVARMMMMSSYFMKKAPFERIYIHALVRDNHGQKMTKSRGNVVDPLLLIERYGADALRFGLIARAAQGRDVRFAQNEIEGYRNFATKLWNAARFCELNDCLLTNLGGANLGDKKRASEASTAGASAAEAGAVVAPPPTAPKVRQKLNLWIEQQLNLTRFQTTQAIQSCRFNDAALGVYHFVWHIFCDWYLELAKPLLKDGEHQDETRQMAAYVFDGILRLLHPFMPFITETLWRGDGLLMQAEWHEGCAEGEKREASAGREAQDEREASIDELIELISAIRSIRAELNVPPSVMVDLSAGDRNYEDFSTHHIFLERLGRVALKRADTITDKTTKKITGKIANEGRVQLILGEREFYLSLSGVIDFDLEQKRLKDVMAKTENEMNKLTRKLKEGQFTRNAPREVVAQNEERLKAFQNRHKRLAHALTQISQKEMKEV